MEKFDIIVADPPWHFDDALKMDNIKRSAQSQYKTMNLFDIMELPIANIANPEGCLLALWVPSSMLQDGLNVMSKWGFKFKQTFIWVKLKNSYNEEKNINLITKFGMGRLFRQSHEIALLGTSGKSIYKKLNNKSQRSVALDLTYGHSVKPETLQDRLEIMFPQSNKIEIFARRLRNNWVTIGDGVTGIDVRESLKNIIEAF